VRARAPSTTVLDPDANATRIYESNETPNNCAKDVGDANSPALFSGLRVMIQVTA
jgi:hypothetical protein